MHLGGGSFGKIGDWYEEDYVFLQWMYMLSGAVSSVQWEGVGDDEKGVDLIIVENNKKIAVQCKSNSESHWTTGRICTGKKKKKSKGLSILECAKYQLEERSDNKADEFRFVSDKAANQWQALIKQSLGESYLASQLKADDEKKIKGLLGANATLLLQKMTCTPVSKDHLQDSIIKWADALTRDDAENLMSGFHALANEKILGVVLTRDALLQRLSDAGLVIQLRPSTDNETSDALIAQVANEFRADRESRLIGLPLIKAAEEQQLIQAVNETHAGSRTFLVHGNVGCGKSYIMDQAIEHWMEQGHVVVPFDADQCEQIHEILPPALLCLSSDKKIIILIDQLDQITLSGSNTQQLFVQVRKYINAARQCDLDIVIGCRSVDAIQNSQLVHLLQTENTTTIEIGPLPENEISRALAAMGLPWNELNTELQTMIKNPLALGMLNRLLRSGKWRGAQSVHQLVKSWWDEVTAFAPDDCAQILDDIIQYMESTGTFSAHKDILLNARSEVLERLITTNVLIEDAHKNIRPFHQILIDAHIAQELAKAGSIDRIISLLGQKETQGIHQSRRLRLAVSSWASQGEVGDNILNALLHSNDIRPLVRQGLILGLADIVDPPSIIAERMVLWIKQGRYRSLLLNSVVYTRPGWFLAIQDWIEQEFIVSNNEEQQQLMRLLSSVSRHCGDEVAGLLQKWEASIPDVLSMSFDVFWQDPSEDSEKLFELRQRAPIKVGVHDSINWDKLVKLNPLRCIQLLKMKLVSLSSTQLSECCNDELQMSDLLNDDVIEILMTTPLTLWTQLQEWWTQLEIDNIRYIHTGYDSVDDSILAILVKLLSLTIAKALDKQIVNVLDLLAQLNGTHRDIDGYLLLSIGGLIENNNNDTADELCKWFMTEQRWSQIVVGSLEERHEKILPCNFIRNISSLVQGNTIRKLLNWVVSYKDNWTAEDEDRRISWSKEYNILHPNNRDITSYKLLKSIDSSLYDIKASIRLSELKRKYESKGTDLLQSLHGKGGWVTSAMSDDAMDRMSPAQVIETIAHVQDQDCNPIQMSDNSLGHHDKDAYIAQLSNLSRMNPSKYLSVAWELTRTQEILPERIYGLILYNVCTSRPPDRGSPDFKMLDTAIVEELLLNPTYQKDNCAVEFCRIIRDRPPQVWAESIVERLIQVADVNAVPGIEIEQATDLRHFILNDTPSTALYALAHITGKNPSFHERLLDLSESLSNDKNLGKRAESSELALSCFETDAQRAIRIHIQACENTQVLCEYHCYIATMRLILYGDDLRDTQKQELIAKLLALTHSSVESQIEIGGQAAILFFSNNIISYEEYRTAIDIHMKASHKAGAELAHWIKKGSHTTKAWMYKEALLFVNHTNEEIRKQFLRNLTLSRDHHWIQDASFTDKLVTSRAVQEDSSDLLKIFDKHDKLIPFAEHILRMVPSSSEYDDGSWDARRKLGRKIEILARLLEECERNNIISVRIQCLDAWDSLIEKNVPRATGLISSLTL